MVLFKGALFPTVAARICSSVAGMFLGRRSRSFMTAGIQSPTPYGSHHYRLVDAAAQIRLFARLKLANCGRQEHRGRTACDGFARGQRNPPMSAFITRLFVDSLFFQCAAVGSMPE